MYTGHAAAALLFKARAPHVPLAVLTLAAYGPDLIEVALSIPAPREGMGIYSHSIPSVVICGLLASLLYRLIVRRPGAVVVGATWWSHLLVDLITGRKPLFSLSALTGLDLYHLPWADGLLECSFTIGACLVFGRVFGTTAAKRQTILFLGIALVLLQIAADLAFSVLDTTAWAPSLL